MPDKNPYAPHEGTEDSLFSVMGNLLKEGSVSLFEWRAIIILTTYENYQIKKLTVRLISIHCSIINRPEKKTLIPRPLHPHPLQSWASGVHFDSSILIIRSILWTDNVAGYLRCANKTSNGKRKGQMASQREDEDEDMLRVIIV